MKTQLNTSIRLLSLCLVVTLFYCCSSTPSVKRGEYLIQGKLSNIPDSTIIKLSKRVGNIGKYVASDTIINGEFSFHDTISRNVKLRLKIRSTSKDIPNILQDLWVGSGEFIEIIGENGSPSTWTIISDIAEQEESNDYYNSAHSEFQYFEQLDIERNYLFVVMSKSMDKSNSNFNKLFRIKHDSLINLQMIAFDSIYSKQLDHLKQTKVTTQWLDNYLRISQVLQQNKNSSLAPKIKSLYTLIPDNMKNNVTYEEIYSYMNLPPTVDVGDDMVDGDLYDLGGNVRHLSEFKNRYILLDFWSQGCGPCILSLPELDELAETYENKLSIVSINSDPKDSWHKFVTDRKLKGLQWNELRKGNTGLAASYQVRGIPHYVLIAPSGTVQAMWSGYGRGSLKAKLKQEIR